jgi:hypothetical protein
MPTIPTSVQAQKPLRREHALDLNRGLRMRKHAQGWYIAEYKDSPGEYFNIYGEPVSPELAAEAGFNVSESRKQALRSKLLLEARAKIDAEVNARIEAEVKAKLAEFERGQEQLHAHLVSPPKPTAESSVSLSGQVGPFHAGDSGGFMQAGSALELPDEPKAAAKTKRYTGKARATRKFTLDVEDIADAVDGEDAGALDGLVDED